MANRVREYLSDVWGSLAGRTAPLEAETRSLNNAIAIVDPSRTVNGWQFIPYNPSILVTRKGLKVFDDMKRDEQVKACLAFKKSAILSSGYEIVSPGDEDDDWEVTQFVRDMLTNFPGGWNKAMKKVLLATDYGYSVTEKIYGNPTWDDSKLAIIKLNSVKPHYIDFKASPTGELLSIIQTNVPGGATILEMPPDKFVIATKDQEFENPYGRSELEAAYRAWWVKENAYKWFAVYLERYGMAPLFALYNSNSYQGDTLTQLKQLVKNIQSATVGIIPRGAKDDLELWSQQISPASKEIFLAALARFDADIGKALLTPSLIGVTSDSNSSGGDQSKGSYARSQTHFDVFMMTVIEEQDLLNNIVDEQVIRQACDLNFPGLKSYPHYRALPVDDDTKADIYTLWKDLVAGKVVNRIEDDEAHIRKALGFPENDNPTIAPLPVDMPKPGFDETGRPYPRDVGGNQQTTKPVPKPGDKPKPVEKEKITAEMAQYADDNDGIWVYSDQAMICIALDDYEA